MEKTNVQVQALRLPTLGVSLLHLILNEGEKIHVIGDLAEEYAQIHSLSGRLRATAWFYRQVLESLRPLIWRLFQEHLGFRSRN